MASSDKTLKIEVEAVIKKLVGIRISTVDGISFSTGYELNGIGAKFTFKPVGENDMKITAERFGAGAEGGVEFSDREVKKKALELYAAINTTDRVKMRSFGIKVIPRRSGEVEYALIYNPQIGDVASVKLEGAFVVDWLDFIIKALPGFGWAFNAVQAGGVRNYEWNVCVSKYDHMKDTHPDWIGYCNSEYIAPSARKK